MRKAIGKAAAAISFFSVSVIGSNVSTVAAPLYQLTDIGNLGVPVIAGLDINDVRQIVGTARLTNGENHTFLFDPNLSSNQLRDLGSAGVTTTTATSINNLGQIVGGSTTGGAFFIDLNVNNGQMQYLGVPTGGANSINDLAQIVGGFNSGGQRAFLIDPNINGGQAQNLGTLGGNSSSSEDINNSGQIVGVSQISASQQNRAFLIDPDFNNGQMQDLGTLGGPFSQALAINNLGQIIGQSEFDNSTGKRRAFLIDPSVNNGVMQNLGALDTNPGVQPNSEAFDINDLGQIVGQSLVGSGQLHAFLFEDGQMFDLNDLIDPNDPIFGQAVIGNARAINSLGDIAAEGTINGVNAAFLLTRLTVSTAEPATLAILALGLAGLGVMRRAWHQRA